VFINADVSQSFGLSPGEPQKFQPEADLPARLWRPDEIPLAQAVDRRVGSNKRHSPVFELAKTRGFARLSPEICRWFKICCAGSYRSSFL
jgi:hypothetical protein